MPILQKYKIKKIFRWVKCS